MGVGTIVFSILNLLILIFSLMISLVFATDSAEQFKNRNGEEWYVDAIPEGLILYAFRLRPDENGPLVFDMPIYKTKIGKKNRRVYDVDKIIEYLGTIKHIGCPVFLEKVQTIPGGFDIRGNTGLMYCEGLFVMGLRMLGIHTEMVQPQVWQRAFGISKKSGDTGEQSYEIAHRLYPQVELKGPMGGLKDGRCDALLIAEYGRIKCQ
jgi:hypothetical protein